MNYLNINDKDKCLIISPHPDDESIGCGGLLLKFNKNCDVIVLTDGCKGGTDDEFTVSQTRKIELDEAMAYANIDNYKNLMIHDRMVKYNLDKLNSLDIGKYDYVFVPNSNEFHVDHFCILKKVKKLLKFSYKTRIVCYEVWSPLPNPDLYLDISDVIDKKAELIGHYKSQIKFNDYVNRTIALNYYRGMRAGTEYAEAFLAHETLIRKMLYFSNQSSRIIIRFLGIKINIRK